MRPPLRILRLERRRAVRHPVDRTREEVAAWSVAILSSSALCVSLLMQFG